MLVVPLQRRHHERSFLPFEQLHLLLLFVLEGRRADLGRPHHAETASVEKDDRRARAVAVAALVSARRELLHVQGHAVARHRVVGVEILASLARRMQFRLPDIGNVVDDGIGMVAAGLGLSGSVARDRGIESRRLRAEVILAAVETLRENIVVVENDRVVVGIGPGLGNRGRLSRCPKTGGSRSGGDSGQANAQKLRSGKTYFFDGVPGGLAVRMTMRGSRVSGAVGMILMLVMRMLMTVVDMTVVLMMMTGIGHRVLPEELPVTIQDRNSCRLTRACRNSRGTALRPR